MLKNLPLFYSFFHKRACNFLLATKIAAPALQNATSPLDQKPDAIWPFFSYMVDFSGIFNIVSTISCHKVPKPQ
ncbi:hypothetical protein MUA01_02950 [Enterobacteriaceae bacterium H18W14]|uniref:hypothetical protein n=1 Tax=Dryocola boscaweniae TaxID=2925397 RepID=UPI0022F066E7|nr:hypothetical protein [Dryocola boscaweniae]MCT4713951.1 hypothetical protein [Dryocola boscaweniae]